MLCNLKDMYKTNNFQKFRSLSSARIPQTVFIEKIAEGPVIITDENNDVDIIGPPDAISNLRPVIRKCPLNETSLQQHLRQMQDATQSWNQEFWTSHNTRFIKVRTYFYVTKSQSSIFVYYIQL